MEVGKFTVVGADASTGLTCDLCCEETRLSAAHVGVGAVLGQLWWPFVRCYRNEGRRVRLAGLQASGRAEGHVLRSALQAGLGDPAARGFVTSLAPGSGGQPGPRIVDIQRILPADEATGRGALYISGGAAAVPGNLEQIGAAAVLRLGTHFAALPEAFCVKQIKIEDNRDADFAAHVEDSNAFLEQNICAGKGVLVHCGVGASRSGAAVIAYVMLVRHLRYREALAHVRRAREWVRPNDAFAAQLQAYKAQLDGVGHFATSAASGP